MMWIELACRELLAKNIVQSDAHAEAAKLIVRANYEAFCKKCDRNGIAESVLHAILPKIHSFHPNADMVPANNAMSMSREPPHHEQ